MTWIELAAIAALILFQPELRSMFYRMRYPRTARFLRRVPRIEITEEVVDGELSFGGAGGFAIGSHGSQAGIGVDGRVAPSNGKVASTFPESAPAYT